MKEALGFTSKKGRFGEAPQAPIEFQGKATKDVAVSIHTHYALAAEQRRLIVSIERCKTLSLWSWVGDMRVIFV
jgi:hypothetical protein